MANETAPMALGVYALDYDRERFIRILNEKFEEDDFFDRPDCIAALWLKLTDKCDSILEDPIAVALEEYMVEQLCRTECEWVNVRGVFSNDNTPDIESSLKKFKCETIPEYLQHMSIKELAAREKELRYTRDGIRYLMFRVYMVDPDTYMLQGWNVGMP